MELFAAKREPLFIPSAAMGRPEGITVRELLKMGIIPGISGGATGFNQAGDIITQTQDGMDLNDLWNDYVALLTTYNSERDRLMSVLTFPVTQVVESVFQGSGELVDFEEASEFGVPRGVRVPPLETAFSLAYDFKWYDVGARFTWKFLADAEARQVDILNNAILEADNRLMFTKSMRAVFNNVTRTANIKDQNYNVYPLYNGDATVPPMYKNVQPSTPHQHYLVSGGASVDSGDLDEMETHLRHHGFSWQNGTQLILLANSQETAQIRTFRVADGDTYDFIPNTQDPSWAFSIEQLLAMQEAAGLRQTPPTTFQGLTVIGRYGPWLIVEEDLIPAGYMLGLASGGDLNPGNLVGIREHTNAGLRGLRLVKGPNPDYPIIESYYQRGFGTGIRQRGGGVVMQVKASGTYDIPAAYA